MNAPEQRRAPRKPVINGVSAIDVISGRPLGNLCNISASGLMLIGNREPCSDGIYQVQVPLPGTDAVIELGLQEQWSDPATTPGQYWAGYRIIAVSKDHNRQLEHWLQQA